jgi:hypothetical protein
MLEVSDVRVIFFSILSKKWIDLLEKSMELAKIFFSNIQKFELNTLHCHKYCKTLTELSAISGFCHDVDEICALLGCYAALSGNPFPTFLDSLSIPSSRVKKSKKKEKKLLGP